MSAYSWPGTRLPAREHLGSIQGHAAYPTATHTLCGLRLGGGDPHGPAPTCPTCTDVALLFDGVDRSVPDSWGWSEAA